MVGGCIIPRRDSHLLQLYAFLQKLILISAEPLLQPHRTPGVRSNPVQKPLTYLIREPTYNLPYGKT